MSGLKLLPSTAVGFSSRDYWDSFFTKRKNDFEWYGEYDELAPMLRKFCSIKDSMLIVGCGSSNMSARLYDDGFQNQRNIDISSVVIKRMQNLYPHISFKEGDVTDLKNCSDEEFSCVLDKGTFDALAPPPPKEKTDDVASSEPVDLGSQKSIQMLIEIGRVLKKAGRFLCISLLQEHVAELLIGYFVKSGWIVKINRCEAAESKNGKHSFPVYICLFFKPVRPQLGDVLIEFVGMDKGTPQRLKTVQDVIECLKVEMTKKFHAAALKTIGHASNSDTEWALCDADGAKYKLIVMDLMSLVKNSLEKQMIIFIIPQGRETEFMFGTQEGRTIVANQMGYTRVVFVVLQRDRQYPSMEEVQKEIGAHVQFITPDAVADAKIKIPVVTVDSDLGSREVIHRGKSNISGEFTVEDVKVGPNILRRLIFLDAPHVIQSEVPLKVVKQKAKGKSGKKETRIPVAHQLTSDYHGIMSLSVPMLQYFLKQEERQNVLVIGLGGGLLVSFLCHYFPELRVTALELDKEIVQVAKNYFGLGDHENDDRLRIVVENGLKFVKETDTKFSVIMFDVDNKSTTTGLSCPPADFLTTESLEATRAVLTPDGIFVLNFVCRNSTLEKQYEKDLLTHFPFIYKFKLAKEVNTVFFCFSKIPPGNSKLFSKALSKSVIHLRDIQIEDISKPSGNGKSKTATSLIEMENTTVDTIVGLTEEGLQDLCSKFEILRAKS